MRCDDVENDLLTFTDHHRIEKGAHGLGVVAAGATRNHERVRGVSIGRTQGQPRYIKHGEHIGVELLVGQAEADNVELVYWMARLEAIKRDAVAPHCCLKVRPRAVGALSEHLRALVDQIVQNGEAEVTASQFVDVGKAECDPGAQGRVVPRLDNAVELAAGVAGGLLDLMEHPVEGARDFFGRLQVHGNSFVCAGRVRRVGFEPTCRVESIAYSVVGSRELGVGELRTATRRRREERRNAEKRKATLLYLAVAVLRVSLRLRAFASWEGLS